MDPFVLTGYLLIAVIFVAVFAYFRPRREPITVGGGYGTDDGQADVQPHKFVPDNRVTFGKRVTGRHPALDAPYGKPKVFLTPRQIERVNIQRKLRGKPPFNRAGLTNAVAHPWDRSDVRQPETSNDWLSYLIMYEILFDDHKSHTVGGCGGLTIDPTEPYNGHGGEFAGAGASGSWGDPITRAEATAIDVGVPMTSDPVETDKYQPGDTVSGYGSSGASDPAPSYSAPDPTPSAPSVSDSTPSYTSSPDTGGGGDSGGGGGGGGGD